MVCFVPRRHWTPLFNVKSKTKKFDGGVMKEGRSVCMKVFEWDFVFFWFIPFTPSLDY